jgi:hypothetical protein
MGRHKVDLPRRLTSRRQEAGESSVSARGVGRFFAASVVLLVIGLALPALWHASRAQPTYTEGPVWSSNLVRRTQAVAMGDVNRDGNLDLVCGNFGGSNTLYFGEEGRQFLDAEWVSDSSLATQSVALGDVNGDGYLDLVCANYNEVNTLYLNNGRSFDSVAIWSSDDARKTLGVALADVDGKGGLDLIFANSGQPNTIHFNKNKTDTLFARSPDWRSEPTNNSVGVCVGDVDGDTYLDVLFANDAQASTR